MKKVKIGDKYLIPSGTKLWFINLQQSFITTKKYVVEVTHIMSTDDTAFFGDVYDIVFEHTIPGLLKVIHGETEANLSMVKPIGDTLTIKYFEFKYQDKK